MAALEYHLNARGYPGFTVPIAATAGAYANNREVVPAYANVDSTGAEIGTVANPFNVNVVSGGSGGGVSQGAVTTAAPTYTTGSNQALSLTTGGALRADTSGGVANNTADSGNPTKIGGVYNSSLPTLTSGFRGDVQLTSKGAVYVSLVNTGGVTPTSIGGSTDANSTGSSGMFGVNLGLMFNGTSLDRVRKANLYARVPSSTASGNPAFLKASAGDVMQFWGQCGATATFLQIYNKTSAPVIGTDTPLITYPMAASGLFSQTIPVGGAYCSTGIAYAFTTDAAGTTAAAAAAVTAFMMLAA